MAKASFNIPVEALASALGRIARGESDPSYETESDPYSYSVGRRERSAGPELNVVPLVDVLFLLMVFFVIAGAFGLSEGILKSTMTLGGGQASGVRQPISPLIVEVKSTAVDAYMYYMRVGERRHQAATPAELNALLRWALEMPGFGVGTPVVILSDDFALWDDVVNAWNAILSSGFREVAFGHS